MNPQLAQELRILLATSYAFQLKAHKYHWNVMGSGFPQYHDFLGELYAEVHGSVDGTAELIRTLGEMSPGSFTEFQQLSEVMCDTSATSSIGAMLTTLADDNDKILELLQTIYNTAEEGRNFDISDYAASRIAAHKKHAWMIKATLGKQNMV